MVKQNVTITGNSDASNGLYYIDLAPRPQLIVQNALYLPTSYAHRAYKMLTKSDIVRYLHCAAFSAVISKWTSAINAGYYTTWPGLNSQLVLKHLPKALATTQGHLHQQQQNVRSTKITTKPSIDNNIPEMTPLAAAPPEPRV